ncbi:MAG: family transcriptional regulator, cyclic receptor protein [Solirubrobacteraceae bacterium]|jgi:CRP-like cAMP-binding protein|nr:family transcriptional regulator, cyclic receptor protein [Solirubrobacteraceae bacterium]
MDPERLRAIPVFASLDDETLRSVAVFAGESSVPAGRQIVNEGDYAHEFMAIEEGTADVFRGEEKIATLGPGDFFGEIGVVEKTLRTASVVAATPMRLITLTRWELKRAGDDALERIRATIDQRRPAAG